MSGKCQGILFRLRNVREMSGKMHAHACVCENSMVYFQKNSPAAGFLLVNGIFSKTFACGGVSKCQGKRAMCQGKVREKSGKKVLEFWQTPCMMLYAN